MKWLLKHVKTIIALMLVCICVISYVVHVNHLRQSELAVVAQTCSPDATVLLSSINDARSKIGSPTLTIDSGLASAASQKSADIVAGAYYGHDIPDGSDTFKYVRAQGIKAALSEELDVNALTPQADWSAFSGSSAHYKSLMDPTYSRIGVSEQCVNYTIQKSTGPDDNSMLVGKTASELTVVYLAGPEPAQQAAPSPQSSSANCTTIYTPGVHYYGTNTPGIARTICN